jgi:hypothetical protein
MDPYHRPVPGTRAALTLLLLAALGAGAPPSAAAEGGAPAPPPPPKEEDKEEVFPALVSLDPFPRSVPCGEEFRLKFRLRGGLRSPVLIVIFPSGGAAYVRPDVSNGNDHQIAFRIDRAGGTHRLTLVGFDETGERTTAILLIKGLAKDGTEIDRDVEIPPADTVYPALDPEEHPLRLERVLFHRMNALRKRQGLAALPWHEPVARSARAHVVEVAKHYETTVDPRTGSGEQLPHRVPGAGPGGSQGPTLAERIEAALAWPVVRASLPSEIPKRGRNQPNHVSEALTSPSSSLDQKFEQVLLRKSDMRAPMVSPYLSHAAGGATWRWYGWKAAAPGEASNREDAPGPPPPGRAREAITTLVFIQVNDPAAAESYEKERREVQRLLSGASKPAERAEALRRVGQAALPESPKLLADAAKGKDPAVRAGALDGLWLCAPAEAQGLTEPIRLEALRAFAEETESRAADGLRALAAVRYDAASRRAGLAGLAEASKRAREALAAGTALAAAGKGDEARTALEEARRRFAGFPEAEEIAAALKRLGPGTGGTPPK